MPNSSLILQMDSLPLIVIMYILNYLDRNNIAAAGLSGLEVDIELPGSQFQTCVSILFVGYLLMQGKWHRSRATRSLHLTNIVMLVSAFEYDT